MKFKSTRNNKQRLEFSEAMLQGLCPNGGLYIPEYIPELNLEELRKCDSVGDIATIMLSDYLSELSKVELSRICHEAFDFDVPLVPIIGDKQILELFHGPTEAFKDFGARFMSRAMAHFSSEEDRRTILVATSGDTGGAVASGFYNVPGVDVVILYPEKGVSDYQEHQMTSLGRNVKAVPVDGTFDDCQKMVKEAFDDKQMRQDYGLSSANSINIARLLPQMVYYAIPFVQGHENYNVSVPSGNLGNLTACLIVKKMGLPIDHVIVGLNENKGFKTYIETGEFKSRASVSTVASAMDVGNPSNIERIMNLFDLKDLKSYCSVFSYGNQQIKSHMKSVYNSVGYLLDPHSAVGSLAVDEAGMHGGSVVIGTASPNKFREVVDEIGIDVNLRVDYNRSSIGGETIPSDMGSLKIKLDG